MCEDEGGEGIVEDDAELLQRRASGNSGLIRCSITQMTKPVKMKAARLASQSEGVSGLRKKNMPVAVCACTATTMDHPDSVNGMVKSASAILPTVVDTSPTTASAFSSGIRSII